MTDETTISEKIMLLKGIELFESLSVGELAAIASVVEEIDYPLGEIIIKEGSDVILEEFPEIFDDEVRGARFDVFAEALINTNGIN